MAASTGALAAEHQRLSEERDRLQEEISALSRGLPEEAAQIVRQADEILASHGERIAELKAKRDEIDRAFDVSEQERRAAAEREREEAWRTKRKALLDEEDRRLEAVADAEAAARALADAVGRALASNQRMIGLAQSISADGRAPTVLSRNDLVQRLAFSISSIMATVPGHGLALGPVRWHLHGQYPAARDWRADEERRVAAGLQQIIETGKAD